MSLPQQQKYQSLLYGNAILYTLFDVIIVTILVLDVNEMKNRVCTFWKENSYSFRVRVNSGTVQ